MAKKRKTLQEKKLADMRHNFSHNLVYKPQFEKPQKTDKIPTATTTINTYSYLRGDLTKTALLTLSILSFQVVLFLLLKNHVLTIPELIY